MWVYGVNWRERKCRVIVLYNLRNSDIQKQLGKFAVSNFDKMIMRYSKLQKVVTLPWRDFHATLFSRSKHPPDEGTESRDAGGKTRKEAAA